MREETPEVSPGLRCIFSRLDDEEGWGVVLKCITRVMADGGADSLTGEVRGAGKERVS